jgi:hypothetical protein
MINIKNILTPRLLGAAIAAAALITPAIASAQDVPSYAVGDANQQIQGTISAINDTWNISVADASGYTDSVELHQGTIINPTGLTLEPGMNVTIDGYADGSNFDAMEIDTPYQYEGPPPVAVYYGPGAWYPGYAYGWGPSFSLFFDLGSHRFEQRSFVYAGAVRHATAPPAGWENRPHGFIGNAGNVRVSLRSSAPPASGSRLVRPTVSTAPRTAYAAPETRTYAAPQQTRTFAAPARTYSAPPQQARTYSAPPQQARTYSAPPRQTRTYSAPAQRYSAPVARAAAPAPRANQDNGRRHN